MHNRSIFLLTLVLLSAICAFAGGIQAPPSAESITGLKTWIEANVTAADVSAEIEGSIATHAADTSTHGVATVAGLLDVTNLQAAANASYTLTLLLDGSRAMTGNLKFSGGYGIFRETNDGADDSYIWLSGGGNFDPNRGGCMSFFGNEYLALGGQVRYFAGNVSTGDHVFYTGASAERMRIGYSGNVLIGTTTDDGVNKLQVNGPVYVASYVSALGYIDRTEAPDTLAEAYAIVQSHEVTADGELDHSKLHPAAWGKRVELRPTGNTITLTIEEPIQDAEQRKDGSLPVKEKIIEEPEMEQIVVPDQSGRDLSMVISAQALVIKDLTKRIEALEAK